MTAATAVLEREEVVDKLEEWDRTAAAPITPPIVIRGPAPLYRPYRQFSTIRITRTTSTPGSRPTRRLSAGSGASTTSHRRTCSPDYGTTSKHPCAAGGASFFAAVDGSRDFI